MKNSTELEDDIVTHEFLLPDGHSNEMRVWLPDQQWDTIMMVLPAMGVRASFYDRFCDSMSKKGVAVASIDWRGHGKSSLRAGRQQNWGYQKLIEETQYYSAWLKRKYDVKDVVLIGHSMGGQVAHLVAARFPKLIDGVITIASSEPFYKMWEWEKRYFFYFATFLVYPVSFVVGHFPGYVFKFAKRESRTMIRDWGKAARRGYFKFEKKSFNYLEGKASYGGKILAVSIADDFFAPKLAADFSVNKFTNAILNKHVHLEPLASDKTKLDHFNWVKHSGRVMEVIEKEMR